MPQAILPDLNTAYITYRREIIINLKSRNYNYCVGSLYAINGILPKEYQVVVSDIEYKDKTKRDMIAKCPQCGIEHKYDSLKIFDLLLPEFERAISNQDFVKAWFCNKCKTTQRLKATEVTQEQLKEPQFIKVVPKMPNRKDGLMDRRSYDKKITQWIENFLVELEHQMGKFRKEYVPKSESIDGSHDLSDSGEDQDSEVIPDSEEIIND